ncbi:peptide-methionine (S)-S-oxide reductase MsrA [Sphingobacterium sp. NPDC055346]
MEKKNITLGGGCFWCTEAIFRDTKGVLEVKSGFSGGFIKNPAYREVRTGRTGHAEVIQVSYDTEKISLHELLIIHMMTHDPTTVEQQGADKGNQYRSIIFYGNEEEKVIAEKVIENIRSCYANPIVTELKPFEVFYAAEEAHQNYYEENQEAPYCQMVITPKLAKYRQGRANYLSNL